MLAIFLKDLFELYKCDFFADIRYNHVSETVGWAGRGGRSLCVNKLQSSSYWGKGRGPDHTHFVFMNCVDNMIGRQVLNTKDLTNNLTALKKVELLCSALPEVGFFLKENIEERG